MDDITVTVERSTFPLTRFFLTVGLGDYELRPGELKKITLPESGEYEIIASSYWIKKKVNVALANNSVIKVKHGIPDAFYLLGIPVIIILSVLTFFEFVGTGVMLTALLVYFLPLLYITFLKKDNYFKILTE
ncbi:hypothetical protein [Gracilimonas mengyeensis]|uniref:Uncharacterized protein n=1 Tax=Gracilimonas mengyeensis TaxID=1302730 RepID=A0A521DBU9_9BACT|nr:hypothetical protein [Gracilimonas mengyeensis]SMO69274.1 hypothetical protein SAMN06265219_10824 [Gracilimonas mengyeensis]